jgi:uncharacterized membrane protein YfcA
MSWVLILSLGLVAGTIGGVIGFGASIILLPALVWSFGAGEAVPVMAIAGIMANMTRVAVWWRHIDWTLNAAYCATAIPAAALGARTMLAVDPRLVELALGVFFLSMIPARRWFARHGFRIGLAGMAAVGAAIGFITAFVVSTGPINTPFFLAYGLSKGAFIGTEAAGSAVISLTKSVTFRSLGALPEEILVRGLIVGGSLMVGTWMAKRILEHIDPRGFRLLMECVMAGAGLFMLWHAVFVGAR